MCPGLSGAHLRWSQTTFRGADRSHMRYSLHREGWPVFEFVCQRIIPGCTFIERGDTEEKLLEQAMDHLRERHNMDYIDKPLQERLSSVGIVPIE